MLTLENDKPIVLRADKRVFKNEIEMSYVLYNETKKMDFRERRNYIIGQMHHYSPALQNKLLKACAWIEENDPKCKLYK